VLLQIQETPMPEQYRDLKVSLLGPNLWSEQRGTGSVYMQFKQEWTHLWFVVCECSFLAPPSTTQSALACQAASGGNHVSCCLCQPLSHRQVLFPNMDSGSISSSTPPA